MESTRAGNMMDQEVRVAHWNSHLGCAAGRDLQRNAGKAAGEAAGEADTMSREMPEKVQ